MNAPMLPLEALHKAISFEPQGERVGNVSWGHGTLDGRAVRLAQVENRFASGSIGAAEAAELGTLLATAAVERSPLILYLDSAGAKVSEGLKALGAFRSLYRAALAASSAGAPLAAVLGNYCFGGSSMLAHLAPHRLFGANTQLAMSGPAVLAAAAGMDALDEMFRAMAQAAIAAPARARASEANTVIQPGLDIGWWLRNALAEAPESRERHHTRRARIAAQPEPRGEAVRRKDLERIYAEGYEASESYGLIVGRARRNGGEEAFVGLVGRKPVGAARAWHFADAVWQLADNPPPALEVFLDCASHAARLEDERVVLSEFITGMSQALAAIGQRGTRVGLTVLGQAGGGVYVALAAPARRVRSLYGAEIQVLPGAAVTAILGERKESAPAFADYLAAGVADEELKIGIVPGGK